MKQAWRVGGMSVHFDCHQSGRWRRRLGQFVGRSFIERDGDGTYRQCRHGDVIYLGSREICITMCSDEREYATDARQHYHHKDHR